MKLVVTLSFFLINLRAIQPIKRSFLSFFRKALTFLVTFPQPAFTCSKLKIKTLEQGVKSVQN